MIINANTVVDDNSYYSTCSEPTWRETTSGVEITQSSFTVYYSLYASEDYDVFISDSLRRQKKSCIPDHVVMKMTPVKERKFVYDRSKFINNWKSARVKGK